MDRENEATRETPDASEVERTVSQQAKQQPKDKPDDGIRPGDLTSENDGGSEG